MIVVTTPGGNIGHQVLDNLLGSSEEIRVIALDPSALPGYVPQKLNDDWSADDACRICACIGAGSCWSSAGSASGAPPPAMSRSASARCSSLSCGLFARGKTLLACLPCLGRTRGTPSPVPPMPLLARGQA